MIKLRNNRHGAITVIVTMMLIPALLISGTAVDLARIHAARAMAQDTNQLIANAALSQYDGLLKDLYGLFGVASEDPTLGSLVNDYVRMSVFGEREDDKWIKTGLGTFNTFAGSAATGAAIPAPGHNLRNKSVLRRQIDEYMKFRGPVILVQRLIGDLESEGPKLKASNAALEQQQVVGNEVTELSKMYLDYYYQILKTDVCDKPVTWISSVVSWGAPFSPEFFRTFVSLYDADSPVYDAAEALNSDLETIKNTFLAMHDLYLRWEELNAMLLTYTAMSPTEKVTDEISMLQAEKAEIEQAYDALRVRVEAIAGGGNCMIWALGNREIKMAGPLPALYPDNTPKYEWKPGRPFFPENYPGLQARANAVVNAAEAFKAKFATLTEMGRRIESKATTARGAIAELRRRIADPECDANMARALSDIADECEAMINNFPNMEQYAEIHQVSGNEYLEKVKTYYGALEVKYRDRANLSAGSLSISELSEISTSERFDLSDENPAADSRAGYYGDFEDVSYSMPSGFKRYKDHNSINLSVWNKLDEMARKSKNAPEHEIDGLRDSSGSDDAGERQQNVLDQIEAIGNNLVAAFGNEPQGARRVPDAGSGSGWGDIELDRVISLIESPIEGLNGIKDWAILMTYVAGMFSHYTTDKPNLVQPGTVPPPPKSIANIPMDPKVNYFYQSEWEYLLAGHPDAGDNLDEVKATIFAIRCLCNLITSFGVTDVELVAGLVQAAMIPIPFVGPALGVVMYFVTHVVFAAVESGIDMALLRAGLKVPMIKSPSGPDGWKCQISNIAALAQEMANAAGAPIPADEYKNKSGFTYEQYLLMFFFVSSNEATLLDRIADLIEWNVINYKVKANANNMDGGFVNTDGAVGAMQEALADANCFRMERRLTSFDFATRIDLKLIFLSMPVFQNEMQRQGLPRLSNRIPVVAIDSRGY